MEGASSFNANDDRQPTVNTTQQPRDTGRSAEPISPYMADSNPFATPPKAQQAQNDEPHIRHGVEVDYARAAEPSRPVGERLESTLKVAKLEFAKYSQRAKLASLAVNAAMFAQIVLNALVTGLAAVPNNRQAQIGVSALGAMGTIIASFLVRVRGTREPERSTTHAQNLEKYIRELEAFMLDEGMSTSRKWDWNVKEFRLEFDRLQTAAHQSENGQPMKEAAPSKMGDPQSAA